MGSDVTDGVKGVRTTPPPPGKLNWDPT